MLDKGEKFEMELENIIKLIDTVSASNLSEFTLEEGNCKLTFKADRGITYVEQAAAPVIIPSQTSQPAAQDMPSSGNVVKSPLVGTFYNAPAVDQEAFVSVGDTVKKGQVIGIVEAMKLMNEVECEFDGVVKEILVENEQMVEYGQPLIVVQ